MLSQDRLDCWGQGSGFSEAFFALTGYIEVFNGHLRLAQALAQGAGLAFG